MRSLVFIILLIAGQAHAQSSSVFTWASGQDPQTEASAVFIQGAGLAIPDKIKTAMTEPLAVSFSIDGFSPIAWGICQKPEELKTYARRNLYRLSGGTIILNSDLRQPIAQGLVAHRRSCFHGVDLNMATGALDQALAEIYDRKAHVSSSSSFDHLTTYAMSLFGAKLKQRKDGDARKLFASDEPRILGGPSVAFTAEFEDFQLDPDFYCRHPGMWSYLNSVLEKNLEAPQCPKPFQSALYDGGFAGMDVNKIYRVEYLYAHPGSGNILEKFGHAMIHVIACAPEHPVPGPECESDYAQHFILTFNGEGVNNVIDGFDGKGIAELYVVDYASKIKSYTDKGRAVSAVPLAMTRQELGILIGTAWEWSHDYREKWNNLNNNCVSQDLDLIRASIPRLDQTRFPFVTPASLAALLEKSSLAAGPMREMTAAP